jgi:phage tail sheath protein FI
MHIHDLLFLAPHWYYAVHLSWILGLVVFGMATTQTYPGVTVTESTRGSVPLTQVQAHTGKCVGISLRGPANVPTLISRLSDYFSIFGPVWDTSYLDDAVRAWLDNVQAPLYVVRVAGSGAAAATVTINNGFTFTITPGTITSFTLTFAAATTASLTVAGLTAAAIQTALTGLAGVGVGQATVTGTTTTGPWTVTFTGTLGSVPLAANALTMTPTGGSGSSCTQVGVLKLTTLGPGVDYNYVSSPAHGLSFTLVSGLLTIFDAGVAVEAYGNVTLANLQQAVQRINGISNLVVASILNSTLNPSDISVATGLTGGTDGGAITAATYVGSNASRPFTGIYAFSDDSSNQGWSDPGFLMVPGITDSVTGAALVTVAAQTHNLAVIDSTFGNTVSAAITERNQYADDQGHAIYCYGWVQVPDINTALLKWVPRSGYRAAHIARSHDNPGGIANVGAGTSFQLRGVAALEVNVDDITQGQLNLAGVDVARNFSLQGYGLVSWAARTISPNPLYTFSQVRVIFNVLAVSIQRGLKPYVFRPIDGQGRLAAEIRGSLLQLLWNMWNDGTLFGRNPDDAYNVVVNVSNPVLLEQGILLIDCYAKPTPCAERIPVSLYRVPLSFDFQTGAVQVGNIETVS